MNSKRKKYALKHKGIKSKIKFHNKDRDYLASRKSLFPDVASASSSPKNYGPRGSVDMARRNYQLPSLPSVNV